MHNLFAFANSNLFASTVANDAAGGAGDAVTVAASFTDAYGNGLLPGSYAAVAIPDQAAAVSITGKSATGFTITLTPLSSGTTLAAGFVNVIVAG